MLRKKSLINVIKRRIVLRRTKSDQFLEVRNMPISDVVSEMDEFFNHFKTIHDLYKKLRVEHIRHHSIKLLAEIDKTKKGFVRAVTLIRTFRDSLPKWDNECNLILAKKLFNRGYEQEAYTMCESLGVNYHDYHAPIKKRPVIERRKKALLSKEALRILEKNNPKFKEPKKVVLHEGPKENYFLYVNPRKYIVHNKNLSKKWWAVTHFMKCVEVPRTISTFDPSHPKIGQYVASKDGKWLQVQFVNKRDNTSFAVDKKERERLKAEKARLVEKKREATKEQRAEAKRLEAKERAKAKKAERKLKYKEKEKQKKLDKIAEAQRKISYEKAKVREQKNIERLRIKSIPVVKPEKVVTFLPDDTFIKDVEFSSLCQRKIIEELPMLLKKPWKTIQMADFKTTTYDDLYRAMHRSNPVMRNLESVCAKYGINLKQ